ncbi:Uncharacterised protein [Achromobacter xylosoxidans]|nr:Uncharacterised protein [Achromobacter xylosoxidans]
MAPSRPGRRLASSRRYSTPKRSSSSASNCRPGASAQRLVRPKSTSRAATLRWMRPELSSLRYRRMAGYCAANAAAAGAITWVMAEGAAATPTRPRSSAPKRTTSSIAPSKSANRRITRGRNSSPAAVSSTRRLVRANSRVASASSSWRTRLVTDDWVWNRRLPAWVKLDSCATATNAVRCLRVTCLGRRYISNHDRWINKNNFSRLIGRTILGASSSTGAVRGRPAQAAGVIAGPIKAEVACRKNWIWSSKAAG